MVPMVLGRAALIPLWVTALALVWIAMPEWEIAASGVVAAALAAAAIFSTMYFAWYTQPVPKSQLVPLEASDASDLERLDSDHG